MLSLAINMSNEISYVYVDCYCPPRNTLLSSERTQIADCATLQCSAISRFCLRFRHYFEACPLRRWLIGNDCLLTAAMLSLY